MYGGGHRAFGADPQSDRGEELRDVHPQHYVARGDLTAAQIGDDHPAVPVDQQRVAGEPAVGDTARLERLDLFPGAAHQLVGDLVVRQRVQGPAAHVLVHQDDGVGAQLRSGDQLGGVGAGGDGGVREKRLLLQRLAQGGDRAAGADGAQGEAPPDSVEEALRLLFSVDDGDVQRWALVERHQIATARSPCSAESPTSSGSARIALTGRKPTWRRPAISVWPVGRTFGEPTV